MEQGIQVQVSVCLVIIAGLVLVITLSMWDIGCNLWLVPTLQVYLLEQGCRQLFRAEGGHHTHQFQS